MNYFYFYKFGNKDYDYYFSLLVSNIEYCLI